MGRNGQPAMAHGDGRIAGAIVLPRTTAPGKDCHAAEEWLPRISEDRPVYGCPTCSESAMQFYAAHPLHPDRTEFFHCHACGNSWEM